MSGKSGGGGSSPHEAPNTLQSLQHITIVDAISEGPIEGLIGGAKGIAFNYTPLQTEAGAFTFQNVQWDTRLGTPDQTAYADIPGAEAEESVGVEVTHDYPKASGSGSGEVTRLLSNTDCTHVRITMMVQGLYEQIVEGDNAGDTIGAQISYRIVIKDKNGSIVSDHTDTKNDKTTSSAQWAIKFPLEGQGPWTITVYKLTNDSEKSTLVNNIYWSSMTAIVGYPMIYPNTATVMVRGDAESFGNSVPSRAYHVKGLRIQVPSNYNPETRTYAGLWDGTFKLAWTDNPAWILRDLVQSNRYGMSKFFPPATQGRELIDKWTLYQLARYCDELVPDGYGGSEPRYTFNSQVMGDGEAAQVIQAIASNFHGMTYWSSGMLFARADMPTDAVKLITQANTIDGLFTYQTGSAQERHSVALVTWYDPDDYGRSRVEAVYDWDAYSKYGYRPVQVTAYGCTSRGQAHRQGLWTLLTEAEQWQVTCSVGLDCYDLLPGDFVKIADPTAMGVRYSGRVKAISGRTVTLDAPVTLQDGETYTLSVVTADGTQESHNISTRGTTDTVTCDGSFIGNFVDAALWVISGSDAAPRLFAVRSITENSDSGTASLELSLREVQLSKYQKLEGQLVLQDTPGRITHSTLTAPTGLSVIESTYMSNNLPLQRLTFSWSSNGDPEVSQYEPQYKSPSGEWVSYTPQKTFSVDIPVAAAGQYLFRVRSGSIDGRVSEWADISFTATGTTVKPKPVSNLTAQGGDNSITVKWSMPNDPMAGYFEVYYSETENLEDATVVAKLYGDTFTISGLNSSTPYWAWVRTVSITGTMFSDIVGPVGTVTQPAKPPEIPDGTLAESKLEPILTQRIEVGSTIPEQLAETVALNAVDSFNRKVETDTGLAQVRQQIITSVDEVNGAVAALQTDVQAQYAESSALIRENATAIATLDGQASAQYTLRTDVNGHISGFGLWNDGRSSDFAIVADRFFITGPNGAGVKVFTVDTDTGAVVINGNLFVDSAGKSGDGWIKGNMIYAKSLIQLADGAIVLDGNQGTVSVFDPDDKTNGNYIRMASGYLRQYQGGQLTRSLSQVETGVCNNGAWYTLSKTYNSAPSVTVSPRSIQTYKADWSTQGQTLTVGTPTVEMVSTGKYRFKPSITLMSDQSTASLSPLPAKKTQEQVAVEMGPDYSNVGYAYSQSDYVAGPAHVVGVTMSLQWQWKFWAGRRGTGADRDNYWYDVRGRFRIAYRAKGATQWSFGSYGPYVTIKYNAMQPVTSTLSLTLPEGQYDFACYFYVEALTTYGQAILDSTPAYFQPVEVLVTKAGGTQIAAGTVNFIAIGE